MNDFALVPEPVDQEWLLDGLRDLAAAHGVAPLLRAPIVLPNDTYFPDRWSGDREGALTLTRRIMRYAQLQHLSVALWVDAYAVRTGAVEVGLGTLGAHQREGAAAWFAGIRRDVCLFGLDEGQLADAEGAAGVLAHEVAHAWRAHHVATVVDRAVDEQLTDVTTVFLGFGVLTANNTLRHRSRGRMVGASAVHEWSRSQAGYLPPQAMSFLLAAQCIARGATPGERHEVARHLETTQAASFDAAWKEIARRHGDLSARLGLPPVAQWPDVEDPLAWTGPLDASDSPLVDIDRCAAVYRACEGAASAHHACSAVSASAEQVEYAPPALDEYTRPLTSREVRSLAWVGATVGVAAGALVGIAVTSTLQPTWMLTAAVALGLAGLASRGAYCGAPGCGARLPSDSICGQCGAFALDHDHPWLPSAR